MDDSSLPLDWLQHADFLRSLARRLVVDEARAEDLCQETWLVAMTHPPREEGNLRGWLARVLSRSASQARRGEERRSRREGRVARDEALPSDTEIVERMETTQRVTAAVLDLPEAYRAVIHLRFYEGLSSREIAERAGQPLETIRTREKRAVARLRERLDRDFGGEREAWCLALAPLAAWPGKASSAPPISTTASLGTLLVTSKKAVALVAASVIALFLGLGPGRGLFAPAQAPEPLTPEAEGVVRPQDSPAASGQHAEAERAEVAAVTPAQIEPAPVDSNQVQLRGRVLITTPAGEELDAEDGRMLVGVTHKGQFEWNRVTVRAGSWELEAPRGSELYFDELRFLELAALVEQREIATPDDGDVLVRARLLERPLLHVVDGRTGAELRGLEIRRRNSWRAFGDDIHPGDHQNVKFVVRDADSPVLLPADDMLCAYWARAEGYAWGRVTINHESGGERTLELFPGGTLEVRVEGVQVPDDCFVRLRRPGQSGSLMAAQVRLSDAEAVLIEDLQPGTYRVEVQQHEFNEAVTLGEASAILGEGEHTVVVVDIDPSRAELLRVPLAGTLVMAPELAELGVSFSLSHYPETGERSQGRKRLKPEQLQAVEGQPGHFRWDAGEVLPGRYMVYVGMAQHREMIQVDPPGIDNLPIVLAELAEAEVRFVDEDTGESVTPEEADWADDSLSEFVGNSSMSLFPDTETGLCRIRTCAGPVEIGCLDHRYGLHDERVELKPGFNQVVVRLRRVCSLSVTVWEDGAQLPLHDLPIEIQISRPDGEYPNRQRWGDGREECFVLVGPGDYDVSIEVGEEYEAVSTRRVHVGDRETMDVRFDLVRK